MVVMKPIAGSEQCAGGTEEVARLSLREISLSFKHERKKLLTPVLNRVSIELKRGERIALVGSTGCGKTTLLNIAAGFLRPTCGSVLVDGVEVFSPGPERGLVFQRPNLFPWMTARENVLFGAKWGGGSWFPYSKGLGGSGRSRRERKEASGEIRERVETLLYQLGLGDAGDLFPRQMSGGMQARAALGRVLFCDPNILLMDEPFGALDALTRAGLHKLMIDLQRQNEDVSAVLVTHDVEEAVLLSDRIIVLGGKPSTIVKDIVVPFGWPREYSHCLARPELMEAKTVALRALEPLVFG